MEENQVHIPEGWKYEILGDLCSEIRMGETIIFRDLTGDGVPVFSANTEDRPWGFTNLNRLKFLKGTIVIGARGSIGFPRLPFFDNFTCTQTTIAITPKENFDENFLFHQLRALDFAEITSQQAVPMLTTALTSKIKILFPKSNTEQTQIATILSKVDEAIAQTEQLIAKYTRIKTGLMQDLLTKGIDENGNIRSEETHEFKDSPLGRIPKEWEVKKMGDLILAIDPQPDHRTPAAVTDGVPYVGISDVLENGEIDIKSCRKVGFNVLEKQQRLFTVDSGDIIFGKIGTIGKPKVLPLYSKHPFTLSANIILIKPHECPDFVFWSLISKYVEDQVNLAIHSTSQPAFGMQKIRDLDILTPLPVERDRITSKLEKLNKVVQSEKIKLSKYQSLKTGLMQDLLSGKVRVNHLIKETTSV